MRHALWLAMLGAVLTAVASLRADETPGFEAVAAKIQAATVTVRVLPADKKADEAEKPAPEKVTVCSGVSLGKGLIVTHVEATSDSRIRITLPGGAQAEAKLRVADQFTGLSLLEITAQTMPALVPAAENELPQTGAWIVSGAAWGAEQAVVAVGHVGGVDRTLAGRSLPPLLQCGVTASSTSAGGPVADRQGRLVGVVVAVDQGGDGRGWVYAVPATHVARLQRAAVENKTVFIPRVAPSVGLDLIAGDAPGSVVVQQVRKDGPAATSGILAGDRIIAVDGLVVRSVYQVRLPILQKRPGDKVAFTLEQNGAKRTIEITLGGAVELTDQQLADAKIANLVNPRIEIQRGQNGFEIQPGVRALNVEGNEPARAAPAAAAKADETKIFEKALERYLGLILKLREQLDERTADRNRLQKELEAAKAELDALRKKQP